MLTQSNGNTRRMNRPAAAMSRISAESMSRVLNVCMQLHRESNNGYFSLDLSLKGTSSLTRCHPTAEKLFRGWRRANTAA